MTIENYLSDLENRADLYQLHWKIPLGRAYADAHTAYESVLRAQAAKDKLKAELITLALSVGMGGSMTMLFGTAVVRTAAVNATLTTVCNRNMTRTFDAMAGVAGSPAGSYMAQAAWDGLGGILSARTKQQVQALVSEKPASRAIKNPTALVLDLEAYIQRAKTTAYAIGRDIRDTTLLTTDQKTARAAELRAAPFFAQAPSQNTLSDPAKTTKEIELMFYMLLVMDSDYIKETTYSLRGAHESTRTRRVGGIDVSPSSRDYPTTSSSHVSGPGYVRDSFRTIEHDRPGGSFDLFNAIMPKANKLHTDLFGTPFEQGGYGRDEVIRAERVITSIQNRHLRAVPGSQQNASP